jgi:hypothetical protein
MTTIQSSNLLTQRLNNAPQMPVNSFQTGYVNNEKEVKQAPPPKPSLALLGLGLLIPILSLPAVNFISKHFMKSDKELGIDFNSVKKSLDYMFEENKLDEKGVTAHFAAKGSEDAKYLLNNCGGGLYGFSLDGSKVIFTMQERASAALHEAGHAINHNINKLTEGYSKLFKKLPKFIGGPKGLAILGGFVVQFIGQGYNKPQKVNGQSEKEKHSILKFIHNNMGKLVFLGFTPILLDEGFATARALKAAKKISPEILKPLKRNLFIAGATFILTAGANVVAAMLNRKYADQGKALKAAQSVN